MVECPLERASTTTSPRLRAAIRCCANRIHFGHYLKERMDKHKIECVIRHRDEVANPTPEIVEFFRKHLKPGR